MNESVADEYLINLIEDLTKECIGLAEPKAAYTLFRNPVFDKNEGNLTINNVRFDLKKLVTSFLNKSTLIAVFVGTCGDKVEKFSKNLMSEGHTLEGYIVDLIGSEIAEGVADYIHKQIENDAVGMDMKTTHRYSPGYCNWSVSDQHKLFSLIEGANCGISLTPTALMIPIKSVSGVVGIGTKVKQMAYKCSFCSDEKCIMRGKGE